MIDVFIFTKYSSFHCQLTLASQFCGVSILIGFYLGDDSKIYGIIILKEEYKILPG